jgi:hypothetical protein
MDYILDNAPAKYKKSLDKFLKEPTLENAHWAQSDMGALERYFKLNNSKTTPQSKALDEAIEVQKRLRGFIHSAFTKHGDKYLSTRYGRITRGYAKDVVPFSTSKTVKKLMNKQKEEKLMESIHEKVPEIQKREQAIKLLKTLGYFGAAGAAGGVASNLLGDH